MKLNIGCGIDYWGDVRLDIRRKQWWAESALLRREPSFNILGDATYLPFRDKVFEEARMFEVLEHIRDYKKALREVVRVTSKKIELTFPINSFVLHNVLYYLLGLSVFSLLFLLHLPSNAREHIWQIDPIIVKHYLSSQGFKVEITRLSAPIFSFFSFGRKAKYFYSINSRFLRDYSWKIIGFRSSC